MISNARGKHSSPGVYMKEIDIPYATKSLGITTLGLVGETLKGPAFEPININSWSDFQNYFGGTSTEKYKGNGYPKYELPYIAKSYLQESNQLEVCRVLGLSGYDAGPAWVIYGYKGVKKIEDGKEVWDLEKDSNDNDIPKRNGNKYPIAILRSKAKYNSNDSGTSCEPSNLFDSLEFNVSGIELISNDEVISYIENCGIVNSVPDISNDKFYTVVDKNNYGKFLIGNQVVSLNPLDKKYILNVFGSNAQEGIYNIFVEEIYDLFHINACENDLYDIVAIEKINTNEFSNYKSIYRYASTPWFVSELKEAAGSKQVNKLFRFHTISDGDISNTEIKISIMNILPDEGLFDVVVRDFNDVDSSPVILERYNKCSMMPGTSNYIGLKIGTFDGEYANKSKYVTVEIFENESTQNSIPCGFLGYPVRQYPNGYDTIQISYNTELYDTLKNNRQYFGMSDITGIDFDILKFKGIENYKTGIEYGYTKGFHLDSKLSNTILIDGETGESKDCLTVDDKEYCGFITPNENLGIEDGFKSQPSISTEDDMEDNIYSDVRLRKFTCCFYGGFDGWDIYRTERTNTSKFKANKYKGMIGDKYPFTTVFDSEGLGLTGKFINSDYYAYLAGYKQFDNPSKVKINLLATPGIDYVNNIDLVNEVLDIVEESRQGDCLYIVTTPDRSKEGYEYDVDSTVANFESSEINTSYAATYYPWVKYYDATNKRYIDLPATKDVVRNFAYTDNVSHPWFASAGMSRGNVDCVKACKFTKLEDEDALYESMINPIKSFSSDGVKIWGNKTMYLEDTPLNRINVRRLMIRVKDLVMSASKQLIFEQNDNTVEKQFRSIVEPILANVKQNRGISDFKVQTDTSAEARDRKELPAKIWIKPINCLEYIDITFVVTPEGATFEE